MAQKRMYVNLHKTCLHIWRDIEKAGVLDE